MSLAQSKNAHNFRSSTKYAANIQKYYEKCKLFLIFLFFLCVKDIFFFKMHDFGYHALLFFDIFSVRGTASGLFSQGSRCACCQTCVVEHELYVRCQTLAACQVFDFSQ